MERLSIVEILDESGNVIRRLRAPAPAFVVGSGSESDLVLDTQGLATRHARFTLSTGPGGHHEVEDLGSELGTLVEGRSLVPGELIEIAEGQPVRLGGALLRITPGDPPVTDSTAMAASAIFPRFSPGPLAGLSLSGLVMVTILLMVFLSWYQSDFVVAATGLAIGVPFFLLSWAGVWAIGNRIFHRRFNFWHHLTIAALTILATTLGSVLASTTSFAAPGWFTTWVVGGSLTALPAGTALLAHVDVSSRRSRRVKAVVTGAVCAVAIALGTLASIATPSAQAVTASLGKLAPVPIGLLAKQSTEEFAEELDELEEGIALPGRETRSVPGPPR